MPRMELGLKDKTIFLSGASGGIGRALVDVFLGEGARVIAQVHRNRDALEEHLDGNPAADRVAIVTTDVRDPDAVNAMFANLTAPLDAGVINAGIWNGDPIPLADMSEQRIRRVIDVNLFGAIWSARGFIRHVRDAREFGGSTACGVSLTFIGSTAGRFGEAGNAEYAASKSALYGLVKSLKNEIPRFDPHGRVNLVEPGWTRTAMTDGTLGNDAMVERAVQTMALRQIADPEDIARTVCWLASPVAARHITGEIVTVAGGMEGRQLWTRDQVDAATVHRRRARLEG